MRRVIESGSQMAPPTKRRSILKNATNLPSSQSTGQMTKPPVSKRGPRKRVAGGGKDHSTPNQLGGGVQTKIPQYLKENAALNPVQFNEKGPSRGGKDKLNDR